MRRFVWLVPFAFVQLALLVSIGGGAAVAGTSSLPSVQTGKPHGVVPHRKASALPTTFQLSPDVPLVYRGGPVLRTNETFAIFWDPEGRLSQSYRDLVVRYLQDVAADSGKATNVYSVLNQYYDESGPIAYDSTFAGSIVNDDPYPSGCPASPEFPVCMTDTQFAEALDRFLFAHSIARPANRVFLVFTPQGVNTCIFPGGFVCRSDFFCAYHTDFTGGHGAAMYANLPYAADVSCDVGQHPNGSDADPVLNTLSHEHREMINDPLPGSGNFAWIDESGLEGSDKCVFVFGPTRHNGVGAFNQVINGHQYLLQAEWSNALAADQGFGCVLDGADHSPAAAFTATGQGSTVELDATVTTDPDAEDAIDTYFWRFGDGFGGFGPRVQHHYAAAGTYHVELLVTDSHGASSLAERDITVSRPTPAPAHAFKANMTEALDDRGVGSGTGNASRLGKVTESASLFWDFSDAPAAYHILGFVGLTNAGEDAVFVSYELTLTDIADPPQGTNFRATGSYVAEGGFGAMANATGNGTIRGTCTSSPTSDVALCETRWEGTIGWR